MDAGAYVPYFRSYDKNFCFHQGHGPDTFKLLNLGTAVTKWQEGTGRMNPLVLIYGRMQN